MWKKLLAGLSFLSACFFGLFLVERSKRKDSEVALAGAEYDKQSALLDDRLGTLSKEKRAAIATAEVEKGRKLTKIEMEKFLSDL